MARPRSSPPPLARGFALRLSSSLIAAATVLVVGCSLTSVFVAWLFAFPPLLGGVVIGGLHLYWPWDCFFWDLRWSRIYPRPFELAHLLEAGSVALAFAAAAVARKSGLKIKPSAAGAWADYNE